MKYILQLGGDEIESENLSELEEIRRNSTKHCNIFVCILSKFPEVGISDKVEKMNILDIREARKMMVRGISKAEIASKFKVTPATLIKLLRNFDTI